MAQAPTPDADRPIEGTDGLTVLNAIRAYKKESQDARRSRLRRNRVNNDVFLGRQDWSHKVQGQSKEIVPKTATALEQWAAFLKKAMTQFGDWYSITSKSRSPLSGPEMKRLLDCFIEEVFTNGRNETSLPIILTDAIKAGSLESLAIVKIMGDREEPNQFIEPGEALGELGAWRLRIDLVKFEDYFPDPSGNGLYEIHSVERDLHEVQQRAEEGVYDKAVVEQLVHSVRKREDERRQEDQQNQDESHPPEFRKKVWLDEFWGTLLDQDGKVVHRNVVATVANDMFILRKPEPNPFWHGQSPFVATPLIRVPHSVFHKALYDEAVDLNMAFNEMFNLILDGGLSSVWGIKQLRIDDLDDPAQVSDGIPQGTTLAVKNSLAHNAKVLETVSEGEIPADGMAVLELLDREFSSAALTNLLKLGSLPPKQVKATEVVELSQSQATTLDSVAGDIEKTFVQPILRKSFLTVLQNLDDAAGEAVISALGINAAFRLAQMSPEERFNAIGHRCQIEVNGLSSVLNRVRDFQKFMALMQVAGTNPLLLRAFFVKFSPDKVLGHIMKSLNIDPTKLERDAEELLGLPNELAQMQAFAQATGQQGQGASVSGPGTGGESLPADINQATNPLSGIVPGGS